MDPSELVELHEYDFLEKLQLFDIKELKVIWGKKVRFVFSMSFVLATNIRIRGRLRLIRFLSTRWKY